MTDDKYLSQFLDGAAIEAAINAAKSHATNHHNGGIDAIKLDDFATPDDNTDLNASTTRHGLCPKLPGGTTTFLRGDGAFETAVNPLLESQVATLQTDVTTLKNQEEYTLTRSGERIDQLLNLVEYSEYNSPIGYMYDTTDSSLSPIITRIDINKDTLSTSSAFFNKHTLFDLKRCTRNRSTGGLNFGDLNGKGTGLTLDGSAGDVLVRIPTARRIIGMDGDFLYKLFIPVDPSNPRYSYHPSAVQRGGSPVSYIYVSAFESYFYLDGTTPKLGSASGKQPVTGLVSYTDLPGDTFTIQNAETYANNIGAGFGCENIHTWSYINDLMAIEYGTFSIQTAFARGIVDLDSDTGFVGHNTGADSIYSNLAENGTGVGTGTNGKVAICWRGIENPYGNIWKYLVGINAAVTTGAYKIIKRVGDSAATIPITLSDSSIYEVGAGVIPPSTDNYISAIQTDEIGASANIPLAAAATSTTGHCDYTYYPRDSVSVARGGGRWAGLSSAGPFTISFNCSVTHSENSLGCRFEYIPRS